MHELHDLQPTGPTRRARTRRTMLGGVLAVVVLAAPLVYVALDRDTDDAARTDRDVPTTPLAVVRAAIGQTNAAGSFEVDSVNTTSAPGTGGVPVTTRLESHGIVNLDPYAMTTTTKSGSTYSNVTTHVNATHVWLGGSGAGFTGSRGTLLTEFAHSIVGALGKGPGGLGILTLANRGGRLNLERAAVTTAQPAGSGQVGDVPVTYYDVTIDLRELAHSPDLSAVQQEAITFAVSLLEESGYRGTTERIGVDELGYVREVTSSAIFDDGSTTESHTVLSNIGCAPTVTMPGQAPVDDPPRECDPVPTTTTTTTEPAPTPTTEVPAPTTTALPSSTSTPPATSTSAPTVPSTPPSSVPASGGEPAGSGTS